MTSDVACPWCAVGVHALERALAELGADVPVTLTYAPFELNPGLGPEGVEAAGYLKQKYGLTDAQLAANRQHIRERGEAVGFSFGERAHVWNTFDAHRLLHLAGLRGRQHAAQRALLQAYHGDGRNPSSPEVLRDAAAAAGLDAAEVDAMLASDQYADEVRQAEAQAHARGIHAVPTLVIDGRYMVQGAHTPEDYAQMLRRIAAQAAGGAA